MQSKQHINETYERLLNDLHQMRDEIRLKIHLAEMEVREEWESLEKKWEHLQVKQKHLQQEVRHSSEYLEDAFENLLDDLEKEYKRLRKLL